jgi:DNA polymerase-3 subunit alpha
MAEWIPLHVHSQYSVLNATASIKDLISRVQKEKMPACALTDSGNMFGVVDFYKAAVASGIKPIIGLEIMISSGSHLEKKKQYGVLPGHPIILLAKSYKGYQNLCKLSSIGYLEGFYYTPRIDKETLSKYKEDLICLSGPTRGKIAQLLIEDQITSAKEEIHWFKSVFGPDFYLQVERHRMSAQNLQKDQMGKEAWLLHAYESLIQNQEKVIAYLKEISKECAISLVATNDIQYLDREDWRAHEILMNIQSGEPCDILENEYGAHRKSKIPNPKRRALFSHEYFFKSAQQMADLFADIPEAVSVTIQIANACNLEFDFKKRYYPVFIPPTLEGKSYTAKEREEAAKEYLRVLALEGIKKRYDEAKLAKVKEIYKDKDPLLVVQERFEYEFEIITSKGMGDYLLIVHDFISWAKKQNIPVGPGRGSGAGSIILYLIGVTDIEPLRFHLFFERFINPERVSYPDIDVDICMERRSEVIDYTLSKYGKDRVAQIITFGTMKAKMAIKDIGRVLSVPLVKVNEIAKLVPEDPTMTLEKALEIDPDFKRICTEDEEAKEIIFYALKLEGTIRNTGIHAAGLIICADPLTDHIPICNSKDSELVATQFAMKPVEMVGLLKIDFLGLKTLTSIQKTVEAIQRNRGIQIDWVNLPLDNKPTFELLNQGKTSGVFQLESGGMQDLSKQLHIDKFEEIIAVGALYRPGPMEMIPSFIRRKHKQEEIESDHPWMKDILEETYGIIVYQEQVMQIAQTLAGYSLGEGDVLRKAMGKKDHQEMANQAEKFTKGAEKKGIDPKLALQIFEKVEKFASYGFNKSHATAYGYLSYVTGYLKANFPKEWMAALMTCDIVDLAKISKHTSECESMNIKVLSPDVNESRGEFVATNVGVRFALGAIKGIGEGVVEAIIEERESRGHFTSLVDFITRLDPRKIGKKAIEVLISSGSFDFTQKSRSHLLAILHQKYDMIASLQKEKVKGVLDLFGTETTNDNEEVSFQEADQLSILHKEKELLGFYVTGHPLDFCSKVMQRIGASFIEQDRVEEIYVVKAACIIEDIQTKISNKNGKKFAILTISDRSSRYELLIFSELFEQSSYLFVENQLIATVITVDKREDPPRLQCKAIEDLTKIDEKMAEHIDRIFEAAEIQAKTDLLRKSRSRAVFSQQIDKAKEKKMENIALKVDADKMHLKDILYLRKLFLEHPGQKGVEITFLSKDQTIATIEIDSAFGVDENLNLQKVLKEAPFIK